MKSTNNFEQKEVSITETIGNDEVVGGHNTILGEIKNTSEVLSKKINKL